MLRREARLTEELQDAPAGEDLVATRLGGDRARMPTIRRTEFNASALDTTAKRTGLRISTLARTWIAEKLIADGDTTNVRAIA